MASNEGSAVFRLRRKLRRHWSAMRHPTRRVMLRFLHEAAFEPRAARRHETPPPASDTHLCGTPPAAATIPKTLFQTWKSRRDIPANYRAWRESFADLNPEYELLLWDDDDNRAFVAARFPWFLETYERYPREIYRADAVRPLFLFLFGGFYADMDTECLRPLSPLERAGNVLLGRMGYDADFPHSLPNAIMASRPFELFWLFYAKLMLDRAATMTAEQMLAATPERLTGPVALFDAATTFLADPDAAAHSCQPIVDLLPADWQRTLRRSSPTILSPERWYGIDWTNPVHRRLRARILDQRALLSREQARALFPDASMVTYWSHSW